MAAAGIVTVYCYSDVIYSVFFLSPSPKLVSVSVVSPVRVNDTCLLNVLVFCKEC